MPFPLRDIRKNPRSTYARVPQAKAQFVLKIEKLSYIIGRNDANLRPPFSIPRLNWIRFAANLFDLRSSICQVRSVVPCVVVDGYKLYKLGSRLLRVSL